MTSPPTTATALIPFVPGGRDFDLSIAFFGELGFAVQWRHEGLVGLRFGGAAFMLQDIDVPDWQTNQMHVVEVGDLDAYWQYVSGKGLAERFAGVRLKAPQDYPWGREVHLIDPAGVCWHVRQAKSA